MIRGAEIGERLVRELKNLVNYELSNPINPKIQSVLISKIQLVLSVLIRDKILSILKPNQK